MWIDDDGVVLVAVLGGTLKHDEAVAAWQSSPPEPVPKDEESDGELVTKGVGEASRCNKRDEPASQPLRRQHNRRRRRK